jgi:hypothetical protein
LAPFPYLFEDALLAFFDAEAWNESILLSTELLAGVFTEGTRDISFEELHDWRLHDDRPVFMKFGHARVLFVEGY